MAAWTQQEPGRSSGVTAIEFALLLPLFLILVFAIVEFGQVLFFQAALQHAVTAAARCASEFSTANSLGANNNPTDCSSTNNIVTVATQQAYGLVIPAADFTATQSAAGNPYDCVSASYAFTFNIPLLPRYAFNITANSCYPAPPAGNR